MSTARILLASPSTTYGSVEDNNAAYRLQQSHTALKKKGKFEKLYKHRYALASTLCFITSSGLLALFWKELSDANETASLAKNCTDEAIRNYWTQHCPDIWYHPEAAIKKTIHLGMGGPVVSTQYFESIRDYCFTELPFQLASLVSTLNPLCTEVFRTICTNLIDEHTQAESEFIDILVVLALIISLTLFMGCLAYHICKKNFDMRREDFETLHLVELEQFIPVNIPFTELLPIIEERDARRLEYLKKKEEKIQSDAVLQSVVVNQNIGGNSLNFLIKEIGDYHAEQVSYMESLNFKIHRGAFLDAKDGSVTPINSRSAIYLNRQTPIGRFFMTLNHSSVTTHKIKNKEIEYYHENNITITNKIFKMAGLAK